MSFSYYLPIEAAPKKPVSVHPWEKRIKAQYADRIKRAHNSIRNAVYPKPKEKIPNKNRVTFTIIGNRLTKEFLYSVKLVQGMHQYRWKNFDTPIIKGCTGLEWPEVWHDLKIKHGAPVNCLKCQLAVLVNDQFIGGYDELKHMIGTKYDYHVVLNYKKESVRAFENYFKASGRPCAYMHISIDNKPIGTLIFMLYSDVVPTTCDNFLRLCESKRGGYTGTPVHRIVKDAWIQCGGFGLKNTNLDCENFIVPHNKRGVLGMANAGRHLDCSTQFYVLLQPLTALEHRFVAFGQLINGEETLKKIEEVQTYFEAPVPNIIISRAGIVNLDCHDIRINKGALEYLDGHVEDLVTIGELFIEMVMTQLFLEIEFREIKKLQQKGEGDERGDYGEEKIYNNVQSVNEMKSRNKKDVDAIHAQAYASKNDNNEFDVDTYQPEEYEYSKVTPSIDFSKEKKPFIIGWTDVPYPGEVDSNFDLKRMLQGDYCLETDLDSKLTERKQIYQEQKKEISKLLHALEKYDVSPMSAGSSQTMDSEEELIMNEYVSTFMEKASFAGEIVERIGRTHMKANPIAETGPKECYTDEDIRKLRITIRDLRNQKHKKISIVSSPWDTDNRKPIQRRQTGFLKSMLRTDDNEEEEDQDDDAVILELQRKMEEFQARKEREKQSKSIIDLDGMRQSAMMRQSVLVRLLDDVAEDVDEPPKLKDFKPHEVGKKKIKMAMSDSDVNVFLRKDNLLKCSSQYLDINTGPRKKRAESLDEDVKGGHLVLPSISSVDWKRRRPCLSVNQYRKMNEEQNINK